MNKFAFSPLSKWNKIFKKHKCKRIKILPDNKKIICEKTAFYKLNHFIRNFYEYKFLCIDCYNELTKKRRLESIYSDKINTKTIFFYPK